MRQTKDEKAKIISRRGLVMGSAEIVGAYFLAGIGLGMCILSFAIHYFVVKDNEG
jgi:hypothetical protein